jgi:radical SAM protein with 4Fe4S-binding SPASM domain
MTRPHLQTIIFEVTQACNHVCPHCYNYWNHPRWSGTRLDDAHEDLRPLLAHVLDQVECDHVTLTGGEPLLRTDLPEIVSFLADRRVSIALISNGHLLDERITADLIQRGVDLFELPLLSHRREIHDSLSGTSGAFDAVLAALANIRYNRGKAVVAFVATHLNIADLHDTLKLAYAFGARGVMLNRFNPGGRGAIRIDDLQPTLEEMHNALSIAETATQEFQVPISCSIPLQPCLVDMSAFPHLGYGFCGAGSERAYYTLDTSGNVRPCNHAPTILGNVWDRSFADIIESAELRNFVSALPAFCADCIRRTECQGGCKAAAQVCYSCLSDEEPFLHANRSLAIPLH